MRATVADQYCCKVWHPVNTGKKQHFTNNKMKKKLRASYLNLLVTLYLIYTNLIKKNANKKNPNF